MKQVWSDTDKKDSGAVTTATNDVDGNLFKKIDEWFQDSVAFTSTWTSNQDKWHKMRMRIKKEKNFPFVGCANLRMPTIETKLRKLKSSLVNSVLGVRPVVTALPTPSGSFETGIKIEKFLDHLIMDVMGIKRKLTIAADQMLEKGFYLAKPYWCRQVIIRPEIIDVKDLSQEEMMIVMSPETPVEAIANEMTKRYSIDMNEYVADWNGQEILKAIDAIRAGEQSYEIKAKDIIYNAPQIELCSPERIYVPTTSGVNPQDCEYIIHEFYVPMYQVEQNVDYKGWSNISVEEIKKVSASGLNDKISDLSKDQREGIDRLQSSGLLKVWECYAWYDLKGEGYKQKSIVTVAPDFKKVLRKIALPFFSGKFPFVKFFYELTDDRWFSHRGLPELIEDIVKEIDLQHMQKLDYQTMQNTPMFIYRAGQINKQTMQFVFGQGIAAQGMQPLNDIVAPFQRNNPNVEFSYEKEQMLLESKAEELIGQVDFSLQSMINRRQPRTLGEVNLQFQNQQMVFSLDAELFRESFNELVNWVWELWCQYGPDEYEFNYFGAGAQQKFETIKLNKEEIQGKYKIVVRATDQNTNPQTRMQKAQTIITAMSNPTALQMGIITPQNLYNAYRQFFVELDTNNADAFVTPPQPPRPQPQPIPIKPDFKELTDGEQAQVLARMGVQPDVQGRALAAQDDERNKDFEEMAGVYDRALKKRQLDLQDQQTSDAEAEMQDREGEVGE